MEQYLSNPFLSICSKVSKQELLDVVDVWIDKAYTLSEDNLGKMLKLANLQKRKIAQSREIEPGIEEEMKISEVNSLINSSF